MKINFFSFRINRTRQVNYEFRHLLKFAKYYVEKNPPRVKYNCLSSVNSYLRQLLALARLRLSIIVILVPTSILFLCREAFLWKVHYPFSFLSSDLGKLPVHICCYACSNYLTGCHSISSYDVH